MKKSKGKSTTKSENGVDFKCKKKGSGVSIGNGANIGDNVWYEEITERENHLQKKKTGV